MKYKLNYKDEEAKKIIPRIAYCVNENWKHVSFPLNPINMISGRNNLAPTDDAWKNREYFLFFVKKSFLESPSYTTINFLTKNIEEIKTNSNSEEPPSQIIIKLNNYTDIYLNHNGNFDSINICMG